MPFQESANNDQFFIDVQGEPGTTTCLAGFFVLREWTRMVDCQKTRNRPFSTFITGMSNSRLTDSTMSRNVSSEAPRKNTDVSAVCCDLLKNLEKTGYSEAIDSQALQRGSTAEFISVIRFIFVGLSRYVHKSISASGYKFSSSNISSFMLTASEAIKSEFGIFAEVNHETLNDSSHPFLNFA